MKSISRLIVCVLMFGSANAFAAKETNKTTNAKAKTEATKSETKTETTKMTAPDFSLQGHDGKTYKLSEVLKEDKHVVLEWFNNDCPYVKKHYDSGNMQALQKQYTDKGVKWFTIASSAKGKQGYLDAKSATKLRTKRKQMSTATLLDPTGEVGKLYGAKTTPHMFVINPKGMMVYEGAIDSDSSYRADAIPTSTNYVAAALDASMAGKTVENAKTKPYGCSVKYN